MNKTITLTASEVERLTKALEASATRLAELELHYLSCVATCKPAVASLAKTRKAQADVRSIQAKLA